PTSGCGGLSILDGCVELRGSPESRVEIQHTVDVSLKTSKRWTVPSLVVDGLTATVASRGMLEVNWGGKANNKRTDDSKGVVVITNGAYVTTGNFRCGSTSDAEVVVDGATWEVTRWLFPYGGSGWTTNLRFVNGARAYMNQSEESVTTYGACQFTVVNSTFARNGSLAGIPVDIYSCGDGWLFGEGSTNAVRAFWTQLSDKKFAYAIDFDGGVWLTEPSLWQPLRLYAATNFTLTTLREAGVTFPVGAGDTLYVGRAIGGAGGVAKDGAGSLRFETQGVWSGTSNSSQAGWTETKLDDPVTLAFEGTLDVRGGRVEVEPGACRTGGVYRAAALASIDFGGNDLGAGVAFSGGGAFENFAARDVTIGVPLAEGGRLADGSPTFLGGEIAGPVLVDFGDCSSLRRVTRTIPVATFLDGAPRSLANWRTAIRARGVAVELTRAADGKTVLAHVHRAGLAIMVR
ncbi:MAG: hypothetical protein IJ829_06075, partial [Kiritimatiellae bacterium]|nr:hypothetical protein [Kiritimatiellia bacterium]